MAHLNNDKYLPALLTYKNNGEYSNLTLGIFFLWAIPGLFFFILSFQYSVDSKQMFNIYIFLLMTVFESRSLGIGSDHSTN